MAVQVTSVVAVTGDAKKFRIITMRPDVGVAGEIRSESVGRIKLVGLDAVRAALGERWPAAAERAMATAEAVIKRHCGPQDSYSAPTTRAFCCVSGY